MKSLGSGGGFFRLTAGGGTLLLRYFAAEGCERTILTLRIFGLAEIPAEKDKQMMGV